MQVGLSAVRSRLGGTSRLARFGDHFLEAGVVVGMGREDAVIDPRLAAFLARNLHLEQLLVLQQPDDVDHRLGLVAHPLEVLGADRVGLELHVAAVAPHQRGAGHVGDVREVAAAGQDADHRRPDPRRGGARLLADGVAGRHVADLVPEHRDELRLGIEVGHDPARDVDVATRQRECVDVRAVEHGERELQVGQVADLGDPLADVVDVSLHRLVRVAAVLLQHLRVHLAADLDFLRRTHRDDVRLARDRIRRAAVQHERAREHGSGQQEHLTASTSGKRTECRAGEPRTSLASAGGRRRRSPRHAGRAAPANETGRRSAPS